MGADYRRWHHAAMMAPVSHLLYLHGFRSSPRSAKAVQVAERVAARHPGVTWWCPQLPPSPAQAMTLIRQGIAHWPVERMAILSSGDGLCLKAPAGTQAIVLAGKPLREPIAQYGPFVMNTRQQLMEAVDDFRNGRLGS